MVSNVGNTGNIKRQTVKAAQMTSKSGKPNSVFTGQRSSGNQLKVSKENAQTLSLLLKKHNSAKKSFEKQLEQDGWAGDFADGISALWGSKNRASKVRKDFSKADNQYKKLFDAAKVSDAEFEKVLKSIAGDCNKDAINAWKKNPTDENFKKAFPNLMNGTKRSEEYNKSQQKGAAAVRTGGKIVGTGIGVGLTVATGGAAGVGVAAISAGISSFVVDESDRMHITGQHKDASGKTVKDNGTFRAGTDHVKILKDAAITGANVYAAGKAAAGAKALAAGNKALQIGLTAAADAAIGAGAEYAQTGEVTLEGTLMNTALSATGSAVATGALKGTAKNLTRYFKRSSGSNTKCQVPKNKREQWELAKAKLRASATTAAAKRKKSGTSGASSSQASPGIEIVNRNPAGIKRVNRANTPLKPDNPTRVPARPEGPTRPNTPTRPSQPAKQQASTVSSGENVGSFNELVPDYRSANNGKVPWRNSKTSINKGQEIELDHGYGQTISLSTDSYTASGHVISENITLNANGTIQYRNGYQYQLKNGESYIYESSPGVYRKIEYINEPFKTPKARVIDANRQEYDAFRKVEYANNVAKSPVKSSLNLANIGSKTVEIPGTNYTVTGSPKGIGFIVRNKVTGESDFVGKGEQIKFQDGTTASCPHGASNNIEIRISAKRNN